MKKVIFLAAMVVLLLFGGYYALAQGPGILNGQEAGAVLEKQPLALSCHIEDESGNTVTQVRKSNPWSGDVVGYWVVFGGGPAWTRANVRIILSVSGLPEKKIVEKYRHSGYPGITATPFAITDWSGSGTGTGKVVVATNVGRTTCTFRIVAY